MEINKISANNLIKSDSDINLRHKQADDNIVIPQKSKDDSKVKCTKTELKSAVGIANKVLFKNNTHLKFEIHEKTKEVMVRIVQDETGEVIKEIPPEKMLDLVAKLWEIAGIIVDEKR